LATVSRKAVSFDRLFLNPGLLFLVVTINKDRLVEPVKTICQQPKAEHDQDNAKKSEQGFSPYQPQYADCHIANPELLAAILPVLSFATGSECVNLVTDYQQRD